MALMTWWERCRRAARAGAAEARGRLARRRAAVAGAMDRWPVVAGWLELDVTEPGTGRVLGRYRGPNMVVVGGRAAMPAAFGDVVTQVAIGTSGTAATPDDEGPLADQVAVAVGAVDYPATRQVRWSFTIPSGTGNGLQVREFGLLGAGGVLLARKAFEAGWAKTADIEIQGRWTLQF